MCSSSSPMRGTGGVRGNRRFRGVRGWLLNIEVEMHVPFTGHGGISKLVDDAEIRRGHRHRDGIRIVRLRTGSSFLRLR
jgi:hypothetical protein